MLNNRTDKIRLLNYLIIGIFILIFVGLITTSRSLAQWPPYNDYGSFSDSFFNPTFSLSNLPYTNSFTSSSFPSFEFRGSENYGTDVIYGNSQYNNSSLSPSYNYSNGRGYDFFSPSPNFSFEPNPYPYMTSLSLGPWASPSPWQGVTVTANNSWSGNWWTGLPTVIPIPRTPSPAPSPAPKNINGEWQSRQLTDEDGDKIKGDLKMNRKDSSQKILKMLDSSLPLGEGSLTKFNYTPKYGEAQISFKAEFDSDYIAEFNGIADNHLLGLGIMGYGGISEYFIVEGEYVIKDSGGQGVDKGTFSLQYGSP